MPIAGTASIWCGRPTSTRRVPRSRPPAPRSGATRATLAITVGLSVAYPDLATPPRPLDTYVSGSTAEIAATLGGFAERGVAHLMCRCAPSNGTALARLADAVRAYREGNET